MRKSHHIRPATCYDTAQISPRCVGRAIQLYLSGAADGVAKSYRLQPPDWAAKCIRSCHRWRPRDQSFHPLLRGKTRSTTELGQRGECKRAMLIAVLHEIRPDFFDPVFPGGKDLVDLCDLARSPSLKETETSA